MTKLKLKTIKKKTNIQLLSYAKYSAGVSEVTLRIGIADYTYLIPSAHLEAVKRLNFKNRTGSILDLCKKTCLKFTSHKKGE